MARKSRKDTLYRAKEEKQPARQALYRAALYGRISVETQEKIDRDTMGTQMTLLREFGMLNSLTSLISSRVQQTAQADLTL